MTATGMIMGSDPALALLRLLQLVSPSLPVGGFTYSQGIEWTVEAGWIRTLADLEDWVADQLESSMARVDLPLVIRLQAAAQARDEAAIGAWTDRLLASRETAELHAEESNRGRALADLLIAWGIEGARERRALLARSQGAAFAYASAAFGIDPRLAATGYAWSWLEGLVLAAVKLVPLGQTQGQQALARLGARIPCAVDQALTLSDDEIGACNPGLAIASSAHESQYTRLFRS